jgi:hypothetical protein
MATKNASSELLQIADGVLAALSDVRKTSLRAPLDAIQQACDEIARAWSGSNIGHHTTIYYAGFQPIPFTAINRKRGWSAQ